MPISIRSGATLTHSAAAWSDSHGGASADMPLGWGSAVLILLGRSPCSIRVAVGLPAGPVRAKGHPEGSAGWQLRRPGGRWAADYYPKRGMQPPGAIPIGPIPAFPAPIPVKAALGAIWPEPGAARRV